MQNTQLIRVDSLTDRALDAMVAVALGYTIRVTKNSRLQIFNPGTTKFVPCPRFSKDAGETLQFMKQEQLKPKFQLNGEGKGLWSCSVAGRYSIWGQAATLAEAACRCLVLKKCGDTVPVPQQLIKK